MVKVYTDLIRKGLWSLDNVPLRWQADVAASLGIDITPDPEPEPEPTPEAPEEPETPEEPEVPSEPDPESEAAEEE